MIDVRHLRKYARTRPMAAVMLGNVSMGETTVGNLTGEYETEVTWDGIEIPESIKTRFRTARYDGKKWTDAKTKKPISQAQALVALGTKYYYLPVLTRA